MDILEPKEEVKGNVAKRAREWGGLEDNIYITPAWTFHPDGIYKKRRENERQSS